MTLQEIEARILEAIPDAWCVSVTETLVSRLDRDPVHYWTAGVWIHTQQPAVVEVGSDPEALIQAVRLAYAAWVMRPQEE